MRRDARSLDHGTLEEMRRLAVKAVLEGESQRSVAARLEVHHQTVCSWVHDYRKGGDAALASTVAQGPKPKLNQKQMERLRRIIIGRDPRQLNFGPAFWTLRLVGQLIEQLWGVVLHQTTVGRILRELGMTPQKPTRRAFQRDEEECRNWMLSEFPRIVKLAKRRQATILFLDEAGIHEDGPVGTTWAPRGKTPTVTVSGTRRRASVISAISPRGRIWFRCYRGTLTAAGYIEFLKLLMEDMGTEVVLIHDRHPAHVAAMTRQFIKDQGRRLEAFELPSYAPNLNPDEHVWAHLKGTFRPDPAHNGEDFHDRVQASMEAIAADDELVRRFFDHPEVRYVKHALAW